jgi:kynurenine formamidase
MQPGQLNSYGTLPVPRLTPELLTLVRTGEVYSLAVNFTEGMMSPGPVPTFSLSARVRHGDLKEIAPGSAAVEVITSGLHVGTHIDALCHIGEHRDTSGNPDVEGRGAVHLYAGRDETVDADSVTRYNGLTHMTIEQMPPILTRGVLLDVAGAKGVEVLSDSYSITPDDIEATLRAQGTEVTPGTAVLVRTGFYRHLRDGNLAYRDAIAGLGVEAARLLLERGMTLAGADNMTVEAMPPLDHAVHRLNLVQNGVTHLENLYLEGLAAARVYEFLLIITPLRLTGATGSWVHPIAIG